MGPSHGIAVIGQALNLSFDVSLDPGVDAGSACAGAELYYGETRIDPGRYRVSAQPGSQPSQAVVQVASQVAVNEPVVSVVLRAGCGQTLSRRYVLLSASPAEGSASAVDLPVAGASQAAVPDAPATGSAVGAGSTRSDRRSRAAARAAAPDAGANPAAGAPFAPRTPAAASARLPAADTAASGTSSRPRTPVGGLPAGAVRGRPRLELQSPADWLVERDLPPLQPSLSMATPGTASPEQRAAAVAMWRMLNGEGDGSAAAAAPAPDDGRLRKLETQLKALQDSVTRSRTREAELEAQLEEARSEGSQLRTFLWPAVFVVLLAALALAAGIYRRRTGQRSAWWKPARSAPDGLGRNTTSMYEEPEFVDTQPSMLGASALPEAEEFQPTHLPSEFPDYAGDGRLPATVPVAMPVGMPRAAEKSRPPAPAEQPGATLPADDIGAADAAAGDSGQDYMATGEAAVVPAPEVLPAVLQNTRESALAAAREMRASPADALLDVQQNAEFFASVGQYEEAIDTLQQFVADHPRTSPVAYLDLMRILHTLSLTDPYRKLRDEFNAVFNAELPAFAGFLKSSRGLDAFPEVLHRLQAVWRKPQVLDVLETFLFRRLASDEGTSAFALEAYRELLMLYEVAKACQAEGGMEDIPPHVVPAAAVAAPQASLPPPPPPPAAPPPVPAQPPSLAELVSSRQAAVAPLDEPLDFNLDDAELPVARPASSPRDDFPEAPLRSGGQPDIDLGLEFDDPSAPMLEFELPPSSPPPEEPLLPSPPVRGFSAPPSADNNLIDFDLFDVDTPPGGKGGKK